MSAIPFNWILFGMILLAMALFVMGLFMVFKRYREVEWTDWRTKRARSQGLLAMLAAILMAVVGIAYVRPQVANYAAAREQIATYQSHEQELNSELTSLRLEQQQMNGSFTSIKGRLTNAAAKLAYLSHERDTVTRERDAIDARMEGYQTSQRKWFQREQDLNAEIAALTNERDRWKSDTADGTDKIQTLKARFNDRQDARAKDFSAQLAALRARNSRLSDANADLATQKQDVINRNSLAMEARDQDFSKRLVAVISQRDRLKADNADLAVQKQDIIDRDSLAMQAREKDFANRHDILLAERNQLKLTISELTGQRQDLIDRQSLAMEARDKNRGSRIDDLTYERDQFKSSAAAMTDQYVSLEKHYAVEMKGRQQRHDAELAELRAQLAEQRAGFDQLNSTNRRLNLTLNQQRSARQTQDDKWNAARMSYESLKGANGDLTQKLAGLEAELASLRKDQADAAKPEANKVNTRATLPLINHFNAGSTDLRLISRGYNITAMPAEDMVREQTGEYYRVALRNPATGRAYQFASGSYTSVTPPKSFVKSLDKVIAEIKKALDGRADYRFYVRGSASTGRYRGKLVKGHRYRSFKVRRQLGKNSYASALSEVRYGKVISNADLPNLRAAYLQKLIASRYKVAPPEILEGRVSKSKNTSEQSVSLILYVKREGDWLAPRIQRAGR